MTEFLKRNTAHAVLWSPVLIRCVCWVVAEVSIAAVALLNEMLKQEGTTGRIGWSIFALALLGKAAMTVRLFLDQSVSQHANKISNEESPKPAPSPAP